MKMTIREFMWKYEGGFFGDNTFETACEAGWHDWFCPVSKLEKRLDKLYPKIKVIVQSEKINIDTMFVVFENVCPAEGSLYDRFAIGGMKSDETLYVIVPKSGHKGDKGRAELWGRENGLNGPIITGTWETIKTYFGV
jgi:hypothetical protein